MDWLVNLVLTSRPPARSLWVLAAAMIVAGGMALPAIARGSYGTSDPSVSPAPAKPTGKWAHTRMVAKVHSRPSEGSRRVSQLRLVTEEGFPEVYKVIGAKEVDGTGWIRVVLPARPNGQKGWVKENALGEIRSSYRLLKINRRGFTAKLWENRPNGIKRLLWRARVGVGAVGTETPKGNFWIREKIKGFRGGSIYGYMAFGTSAYSKLSDWPGGGVVGVHGTNEPWLIPGEISHGCVRVKDPDIKRLSKKLFIGTPVEIR